MKFDQTR